MKPSAKRSVERSMKCSMKHSVKLTLLFSIAGHLVIFFLLTDLVKVTKQESVETIEFVLLERSEVTGMVEGIVTGIVAGTRHRAKKTVRAGKALSLKSVEYPVKSHIDMKVASPLTTNSVERNGQALENHANDDSDDVQTGDLQTVDIRTVDSQNILEYHPSPNYPKEAIEEELEGEVLVEIATNDRGDVVVAKLTKSSGYLALDEEALKTVKIWRLRPFVKVLVPFQFQLSKSEVSDSEISRSKLSETTN